MTFSCSYHVSVPLEFMKLLIISYSVRLPHEVYVHLIENLLLSEKAKFWLFPMLSLVISVKFRKKCDFSKVEFATHFSFHLGRGMLVRKSHTSVALHVSMCMSSKTIYGVFFYIN